jgi:predicted transcriptional regulator
LAAARRSSTTISSPAQRRRTMGESLTAIAKAFGVSRATLYGHLETAD